MKPGRYYSYETALAAATALANALRSETGILRCDECVGGGRGNVKNTWFGPSRIVDEKYGKNTAAREACDVKLLPKPCYRSGSELMCEIVIPTTECGLGQ